MQSIQRKKNDEGRMSEATSFTLVVLVLTSKYLPLFLINGNNWNSKTKQSVLKNSIAYINKLTHLYLCHIEIMTGCVFDC